MLSPCALRKPCWESIAPRLYRRPLFSASSRDNDSGTLEGAPEGTLPWNAPCACAGPLDGVIATEPVCANTAAAVGNRHNARRNERSHWYRMRTHSILQNLPAMPAV